MPEIEINSTIKAVAAVTALLAAYFSSSEWLKALLAKLNPFAGTPTPVSSTTDEQIDEAIRVLMLNSKDRKCRKSIELLNAWIETRNLFSIPETTEGA